MRCAITISYNGTNYLGSQVQRVTSNTIFGEIENVLHQLGIDSKAIASGRTDKGVHATGQVFHIDLPTFWKDVYKLSSTLNKMLPNSIRVTNCKLVEKNFHARYSAKKRTYRYLIKVANPNPFEEQFVTFIPKLDYKQLKKKITLFIGEHDFQNFMKMGSETKSTSRIIYKSFAYKYKDYFILHFEANGFLRSQIRMMVGALLQLSSEQISQQLSLEKKHKIKPAPSNGLYLAKVKY